MRGRSRGDGDGASAGAGRVPGRVRRGHVRGRQVRMSRTVGGRTV